MWMGPISPLAIKLVAFGEVAFIQVSKGISPRCMIYYRGQMIMSLRSAPPLEGLRDYSFDQSVMLLSRIGAMSGRVKMSKFLLTVCAFGLLFRLHSPRRNHRSSIERKATRSVFRR